jgi:hypothetical protein
MSARHVLGYLLLTLTLLVAQQGVNTHALTHPAGSAPSKEDPASAPHGKICALCIAATHAGSALVGAPPVVHAPASTTHELVCAVWTYRPALTLAFSSRAPPTLL